MTAQAARVPRRVGVLGLLAVAEFMLTLDLSIVNVALPSIRGDLGFSDASLQWVVNGYALTFGGFLLLGGRAADLFGGRRVFLGALSAFSLASLAAGLAPDQITLVIARTVQGLSAGVLSPATLSVLTRTYRRQNERNRALSIWTAVAIGGGSVGALAGGVLTALSWRLIFLLNVPIGTALLVAAFARLTRSGQSSKPVRLDVAGAATVTGGLTALVWALIYRDMIAIAVAAVLLAGFVVVETRLAPAPLVPFGVFRSRRISAGNLLSFLSFVPVMATWYFLTLYLQGVRDLTPLATGLLFLPVSLAVVGGSQLSFRLITRVDARLLFAVGGVIAAAGTAWLGRLTDDTGEGWVIVPACLSMVGGGLMFAPVTVAATSGVPPEQGGLASGLLNTTRQVGGALGLAVLGAIAGGRTTAGYATAFTLSAAIYVLTAVTGSIALPARVTTTLERPGS